MDMDVNGRLDEIEQFVGVWKDQCQEVIDLVQTMRDKGVVDFGGLVDAHRQAESMDIWLDEVLFYARKAARKQPVTLSLEELKEALEGM